MNHVVIMAGGIGSRFWPISTPEYPKQFIDILGCGRTLIQLTYDRFVDIIPKENIWVVTNVKYIDIVKKQLPNIPLTNILAEPCARNTAPCISWAGWKIHHKDNQANIVITPSDAVVMNVNSFHAILNEALCFTEHHNAIITLGIRPNRPETGYGYIHISQKKTGHIFKILEFKEKPTLEIAKKYCADGKYLWNAGIFVWNIQTLIDSIHTYTPDLGQKMNVLANYFDSPKEQEKTEEIFPLCENKSIDFAVMETHPHVYTIPSNFGWSDLGNWASLYDKLQKDNNGNGYVGNIELIECKNCIVHAENAKQIVLQGLEGYIFAENNGKILVCRRNDEQKIKDFNIKR